MSCPRAKALPGTHRVAVLGWALAFALTAGAQAPTSKDVPTLARETSPSVVRIILRDQNGAELGSGSGFLIASDGKVVTNYHVIHITGTTQAEARFVDGASYQVQSVLASDPNKDLAVLKLQATGKEFQSLHLGDSEHVQIGERVIAIGSPLAGLSPVSTEATVSDGIVSGIRDWPEHQMKVFQITAPISPGSSGGALLNSNGDVIGVTFAQLVGGQNLNFAVPVTYVRPLLFEGQVKSLASINTPPPDDEAKKQDPGPSGPYTGVWQSSKFGVSGAATMRIKIREENASAEIFLTGGEVTHVDLSGTADKTGENTWTVVMSSRHPNMRVRGIFHGDTFVGDYTYRRSLMLDQGQWVLKKE